MQSRENSTIGDSQQSSQGDSAPSVEYVPKKKSKKSAHPRQTQWVCIMPDEMASTSSNTEVGNGPSFISLLDPGAGSTRRYLLSREETEICEVLKFSDEPRSWFIGNSMQREGNLHVCTPVDPLFLALPYLIRAAKSGKFTTLDTILDDPIYHSSRALEKCVHCDQWEHVCDTKVLHNGMKVYRYSQGKTLQWLKSKVESLSEKLRNEMVYVGSGSQSAVLVKSNKQSDVTKEEYLCYACGMVSDYLPKEVADELSKSYSFSKSKARKFERDSAARDSEPPAKKQHCEDGLASQPVSGDPLEDYTKFNTSPTVESNKVTKLTAAQKSLAKVDKSGMKSLTSFFTNKNKKKS